jgi:peroxiredoxin
MQKPPLPIGRPAPVFITSDAQGKQKRNPVKEFAGQPFLLFFACGCSWCADFAKLWGAEMRGRGKKAMRTVVVYAGSPSELKEWARQTTLPTSTLLIPDPEMRITEGLYHADPCPRLFVIDKRGIIRYVNVAPGQEPRKAPADLLLACVLEGFVRLEERARPADKRNQSPDKQHHKEYSDNRKPDGESG